MCTEAPAEVAPGKIPLGCCGRSTACQASAIWLQPLTTTFVFAPIDGVRACRSWLSALHRCFPTMLGSGLIDSHGKATALARPEDTAEPGCFHPGERMIHRCRAHTCSERCQWPWAPPRHGPHGMAGHRRSWQGLRHQTSMVELAPDAGSSLKLPPTLRLQHPGASQRCGSSCGGLLGPPGHHDRPGQPPRCLPPGSIAC